ncbi:hypothetical protein [Nonomuraea sp. SBT364]|uniref:hypothetical protein n=1 Tax=Nonomuraea sp. SBT364 TaxID=1580530 RepID=UPI000AFAE89D|nr:hypothetical protein [Nonomuraea sp. SBT364]
MAEVDRDGTWRLTALGRALAPAVQRAYGDWAVEYWDRKPVETMPGLTVVPRLAEPVARRSWRWPRCTSRSTPPRRCA